jgi:hypothetical protein
MYISNAIKETGLQYIKVSSGTNWTQKLNNDEVKFQRSALLMIIQTA